MSAKNSLCSNYKFTSVKNVSTANTRCALVHVMIITDRIYLCILPKLTCTHTGDCVKRERLLLVYLQQRQFSETVKSFLATSTYEHYYYHSFRNTFKY